MDLRTALQTGFSQLRDGGVNAPKLTAEVLLCHTLSKEHIFLLTHPEDLIASFEMAQYDRALRERVSGKPTQYITGKQEFWGREFKVSPAVLIPRPESEHLIETTLALARNRSAPRLFHHADLPALTVAKRRRILDIGTGSGALAVTLALELNTRVIATDISADALAVARGNALRMRAPCSLVQCDLGAPFGNNSFDFIVCNPPYIATETIQTLQREVRDYEPRLALDGGSDGLDFYRRLIPEAARLLRLGGRLILEIGADQGESVPELLVRPWRDVNLAQDLAGRSRVVSAQRWG
jgi:release factor glutamine methyltransferase